MDRILIGNIFAGICILAFASGCTTVEAGRMSESGEPVRIEKQLGVSASLRFEDVPVPAGFNILHDQSFIFQDASIRVGLLRYAGRAASSQITSFFKTQMALYNWDLLNIVEHGNVTMTFLKSDENCVITIEPLATKTVVSIVISPKRGTVNTGLGITAKGKF